MPAQSKAQRRLFAACEHGAEWASCKKIRKSMPTEEMHKMASVPEKGMPMHKVSRKRGFRAAMDRMD